MAIQYRPNHVVRADLQTQCPNLAGADWTVTSPLDDSHQCIAWAACRTDRKWWPAKDYYWPDGLPTVDPDPPETASVEYFVQGFRTLGYKPCESRAFEVGYQKVAIFANEDGVTHMARQHFLGRGWLSKVGDLEDIRHRRLEDVEGSTSALTFEYGEVVQILKRGWWTALFDPSTYSCWCSAIKFWVRLRAGV